jgi:hypothetical protein
MCPAGDLGDNAAIFGVQLDLRGHDVAQDLRAIANNRGTGLITGRFNSENKHSRDLNGTSRT